MRTKKNPKPAVIKDKPYLTIRETCNLTGLSQHFLREGCKTGEIPHFMSGNVYMINISLLKEYLDEKSRQNAREAAKETAAAVKPFTLKESWYKPLQSNPA